MPCRGRSSRQAIIDKCRRAVRIRSSTAADRSAIRIRARIYACRKQRKFDAPLGAGLEPNR